MTPIWAVTCLIFLVGSLLTAWWLIEQHKIVSDELKLLQQELQMQKILDPLITQPQSGLMINCPSHGNIPITQAEYDKQVAKTECRCPVCGIIPRRIWKVVINDKG